MSCFTTPEFSANWLSPYKTKVRAKPSEGVACWYTDFSANKRSQLSIVLRQCPLRKIGEPSAQVIGLACPTNDAPASQNKLELADRK